MDNADGGSDGDGKANCFDSRVIEYRHSLWNPDSTGYAFLCFVAQLRKRC